MANWLYKLDLRDLWKATKYNDDTETKMSMKELGKQVAIRLRRLHLPEDYNEDKEEIADRFEFEIEDGDDADYFDEILEELYNLADSTVFLPSGRERGKLLWIETV